MRTWAVVNPDGEPMLDFIGTSRYDAVEDYVAWRAGNFRYAEMLPNLMDWRECVREGFSVVEFELVPVRASLWERIKAVLRV